MHNRAMSHAMLIKTDQIKSLTILTVQFLSTSLKHTYINRHGDGYANSSNVVRGLVPSGTRPYQEQPDTSHLVAYWITLKPIICQLVNNGQQRTG